jgi:hypothetical protein
MNSFKVICVRGVSLGDPCSTSIEPARRGEDIYEGEVYTAVSTIKVFGMWSYRLAERCAITLYNINRFIPLMEVSDEEIAAEEEGAELDRVFRDIILEAENA